MSALWLLAVAVPLALAPFTGVRGRLRRAAVALAPWSALPALALALWSPAPVEVELPWLMLGAQLGVDVVGRVFLVFTSLIWTASGVYAGAYVAEEGRARFFFFFLLSLAGNLGVIVAQDLATFYLFFSLMTIPAYGLIVHNGGLRARRAGRVYIVLTIFAEAMLLTGGLLAAATAPGLGMEEISTSIAASPWRDLVVLLLLLGFGVKVGILPLHVWLPLAYRAAPTPASAVLAGSMINAGLLGWLRFLPLGTAPVVELGTVVLLLGIGAAFYGVAVGVTQENPKAILAYSSISQMGIMSAALGAGLLHPDAAPAVRGALLAFAVHHGLAKSALFLGAGAANARSSGRLRRPLILAGLAFPALALAGAPLTSGSQAKHYVAEVMYLMPAGWAQRLDLFLPLSAVGTTLLMARFLQCTFTSQPGDASRPLTPRLWVPWLALVVAVGGMLWVLPHRYPMQIEPPRWPDTTAVWVGIWPVVAGAMLFWGVVLFARRAVRDVHPRIPPGDLLVLVERGTELARRSVGRFRWRASPDPIDWLAASWYGLYVRQERWPPLRRLESLFTRWGTAGLLLLLLGLILVGLLHADSP